MNKLLSCVGIVAFLVVACKGGASGETTADPDGGTAQGSGGKAGGPGNGMNRPDAGSGGANNMGGNEADPDAGDGAGGDAGGASNEGGTGPNVGGGMGSGGNGQGGMVAVSKTVDGLILAGPDPLPNVTIVIDGKTALTDEKGAFRIEDVADTYQLIAIADGVRVVRVVDGLSTREPELNMYASLERNRTSSVAGKLSGGAGIPIPAGHQTSVVFVQRDYPLGQFVSVGPSASDYTLGPITWVNGTSLDGTLSALQWKGSSAGVEEFTGFASKPFTVHDGQTHGHVDGSVPATNLTLVDPPDATIEGTISLPSGLSVRQSDVIVGDHQIPYDLSAGQFSIVVPDLNLPQRFVLIADDPDGQQITMFTPRPGSGPWNITAPKPPRPITPLDRAASVTVSTEFTWTDVAPGTVSEVWWVVGEWTIFRTTTATKTTLPDLSGFGLDYTPGSGNTWTITYEGSAATPDALIKLQRIPNTSSLIGYGTRRAFTLVK